MFLRYNLWLLNNKSEGLFMSAYQPLALADPLYIDRGGNYSLKGAFFSPLRFCGRQWMWIKSDNNKQIALKILSTPFLGCATILSFFLAAVGALIFSSNDKRFLAEYHAVGDISLLKEDISNNDVAKRIKDSLNKLGCQYSVEVQSINRTVINDYCIGNIHRIVTLTNPSNTKITRYLQVIKNHFNNTEALSLDSVYTCVLERETDESLSKLKAILELHKTISFSIAFDLAYVNTEIVQ